MKILSIGNSFSDDAHAHLNFIARMLGEREFINTNLYIGGCPIELHYNNAVNDEKAYTATEYNVLNTEPSVTQSSIKEALENCDWDIITLQQASIKSGIWESYNEKQINYITDYCKKYCRNKSVRFAWHATWAYADGFENLSVYNNSQLSMYRQINSAVKNLLLQHPQFTYMIPNTAAVQNARAFFPGEDFTRDGFHLSLDRGRFIAALCFYAALTKKSIDGIKNMTSDIFDKAFLEKCIEIVNASVKKPFEISF